MKKIFSAIFVLAFAGAVHAKGMHKLFGTSDKIIKGASKIEIYLIDAIPIMSPDQVQAEDYIYDYRITKRVSLKRKAASGIIKAVLDSTQYLYDLDKKCPFMGTYAVQFKKGNQSLTLILSGEPCDKAIIFCPGSTVDKKHIDLVDKSSILAVIKDLLNPKVVYVEEKK